MSAVAKLHVNTTADIVKLVETTPSLVLMDREKFNEFYEEIAKEVRASQPDVTTDKGRKAVASLAFRVTKTKTAIDEAGKKLGEDMRRKVKTIDEARKTIRDELDLLRDEARKPLTDWEAAEEKRVAARKHELAEIEFSSIVAQADTSETIEARLETLRAIRIDAETFQEFEPAARRARDNGVAALTSSRRGRARRSRRPRTGRRER